MTDKSNYVPGRARGRGDRAMPRTEETLRRQVGRTFHLRMSAAQRYVRGALYPSSPPQHQKPSQGSSSPYIPGPPQHQRPPQESSSIPFLPGLPQHQKHSQVPSLSQHAPFQETKVEGELSPEEKQENVRKAFSSLQLFSRVKPGVWATLSSEPMSRISGDKKKGRMGVVIPVQMNLIRLETSKKDAFHQYNVRIEQEVGSLKFGRRLIRQAESQAGISKNYVMDGSSFFCTKLLNEERVKEMQASTSTATYKVSLTHVASIPAGSQMQLLNIIFKSCSLYSGFFSSILEYENGTRLMMDVSHKLVSTETVLEVIQKRDQRSSRAHVGGKIVYTRYNDRTYKIEDFDKNPHFTFTFRKKEMSVAKYYKIKYNIEIRNCDQPLLVVRPKKRELRAGAPRIIYLVPELCHTTGFSNEVHSINNTMGRPSQQRKLKPQQRKLKPKQRKLKPQQRKLKPQQRKLKPQQRKLKPQQRKLKPQQRKLKPQQRKLKPQQRKFEPQQRPQKMKNFVRHIAGSDVASLACASLISSSHDSDAGQKMALTGMFLRSEIYNELL